MNLPQLTFTRFIAAIVIVIYHFGLGKTVFPFNLSAIESVLLGGNLGVSYFYVLSGFVMVVAYYGKELSKKDYWLLRLVRVYPVHLLILLYIIVVHRDYVATYFNSKSFLSQFTLMQSWSYLYRHSYNWPAWSLSVEIFFYFMFPFLLIFIKKTSEKTFFITTFCIWIGSLLVQFLNYSTYYDAIPLPINHFNSFLVGMVTALLFKKYQLTLLKLTQNQVSLISILSLICILLVAIIPDFEIRNFGLISPIFGVLLIGISLNKSWLKEIFSKPFFVLLGEISFGIYMIHWPLWLTFTKFIPQQKFDSNLYFWLYFLVLNFISYLSFKFIETPSRLLMRNFLNKK